MSLKSALTSRISARLTSEKQLERRRAKAETARRREGRPHQVDVFIQADDPYTLVLLKALGDFQRRYLVVLTPYLVGHPDDGAAPERERLIAYSRIDAARLGARSGYAFADPGHQPPAERVTEAEAALAGAMESDAWLDSAMPILEALWTGAPLDSFPKAADRVAARKQEGDAAREKVGLYLGATLHYEGELYWGLDRLHHLEKRLQSLGAGDTQPPLFAPPEVPSGSGTLGPEAALHWYPSYRSPYTALTVDSVKRLADTYGVPLKIRFVLPMVMRGLPIPGAKRAYILQDVAREARRLGVPFGRVADPVGEPVRRGYAILPWAISEGRGFEFTRAFMRRAWSEGVDMGSDRGLRAAVEEAGLDWAHAKSLIGTTEWEAEAEANRLELLDLGLWGVPSFRVGDVATWGQDRMWVVEEELQRRAASNASNAAVG